MYGSDGIAEKYPIILDLGKYGKHPCISFKDAKRIVRVYVVAPRIFAYVQGSATPIHSDLEIPKILAGGKTIELYPSRFNRKRLLGLVYCSSQVY